VEAATEVSRDPDPRQEALSALETFERERCHGLSKADAILLCRLRSAKYHRHLSSAWKLIRQHRKSSEDEQLLIGYIFSAWHFALEVPAMFDAWDPVVDDFQRLRRCANELRGFFEGSRIRYNGEQPPQKVVQLLESLSWAIDLFEREEREISTLPARLRLNRKTWGTSADAQRIRFTKCMCDAMCSLFGQPLYRAVADIATIVLKTDVDDTKVRGATRHSRLTEPPADSKP
jgi:hypothetical protein